MTSLQKQLAAIAASSTHQLDLKAQKTAHGKSLLFEPRIAAGQSYDLIYSICYEGYRDLCALDHRFLSFSKTVFSEQSKAEDRSQMTKKENEELDRVLESFITLVGPRLLLKPAEKALDWLVRRFRVHEYNTECLVLSYLPLHNTPQFLALLSILPSNPPPTLRFLHPYQAPPTNPPRRAIVYTAVNTPAFFVALQGYVVRVLQEHHHGPGLLSFWASVTTQSLDGILDNSQSGRREIQAQRTEQLLLRLLPALNECLKLSDIPEAVMGCYMIIIVLVTKTNFEDKVLDSLFDAVVRSNGIEVFESCLTCLAVIAEERAQLALPASLFKRLFKIADLARLLRSLAIKCRVERLALACVLGALDNIGRSTHLEASRALMLELSLEADILDSAQLSVVITTLLRHLGHSTPGSNVHGQFLDIASYISEKASSIPKLHKILETRSVEFESAGVTLLESALNISTISPDSDEEMLDAIEDKGTATDTASIQIPTITETSFLDASPRSFPDVLAAFEHAVAVKQTHRFLHLENLQSQHAAEKPLFLSFLVRSWCHSSTTTVRLEALRYATDTIKRIGGKVDLQHLIPYIVYALADSSAVVRRAAAACTGALSETCSAHSGAKVQVWGADLYGAQSSKISLLKPGEAALLLSTSLVPFLEECALDPNSVIRLAKEALEGSKSTKGQTAATLKSPARTSVAACLGSHLAVTPLLGVRVRLLSIFSFVGKHVNGTRTNTIIPTIKAWCALADTEVNTWCANGKVEKFSADRGHLEALIAREPESVQVLQDLVSGNIRTDRLDLIGLAFDRVTKLWSSFRSDSRLTLSQCLLTLALHEKCITPNDDLRRVRAMETLRSVNLDTAILLDFIESIPNALQMPEGPPTKKRRRSSRNEVARVEMQSHEDVSNLLRRTTVVLELIEASNPSEHPILLKNLFGILGDLQQLRQQSGSELVYLQSLILGSLTPIVNQLKDRPNTAEYQAAVRADLLVDCIRHSTSPQVQNAALLLIASLASWVPELVLHNLMPIFTFIGSTLLRQSDDYSAHVVDQTISRVVPQLAESLRKRDKSLVSGVADLLLSFTAAFEHVPLHRRLKLFSELARTLGPEDSLSAIIALLVDRYPGSSAPRKFIPGLLLNFDPVTTLEAIKGYLSLVIDGSGTKRKISDTLFSLNEKEACQIETSLNHLLNSLADLAADQTVRTHISKAFRKSRDRSKPRAVFANIIELIIQLSKQVTDSPKLIESCRRVLTKCLDLLPTTDLVKSAELLLENTDSKVQVAAVRSVELRAGAITQNDQPSVASMLSFLPHADLLLQQADDVDVKAVTVSCIDRIVERFGKKDIAAVEAVARTIAGSRSLASEEDRVRILSLLCITSIVDVLEEEAISLLPTVLPIAFKYLKEGIEKEDHGLHNAVFVLLTNVVDHLAFIFSREYMITALDLAQQSAASELGDICDEARRQFYQSVSVHLGAQESFAAIRTTWSSALGHGYEPSREMLGLVLSTVENQPKSKMVRASSTLFSVLLDAFRIRSIVHVGVSETSIDHEELEQLEDLLIETVITMTLKLNDTLFRPFFVQLVDLASSTSQKHMSYSITFCKFLSAFFERFKSIVTSYSSYIVDHTVHLLNYVAAHASESELRNATLHALQKSFQYDQDNFWQSPSHYGQILKPLLSQLTLPNPVEHASSIIPSIVELATASASSIDNHREMNAILLKYMRAEDAHTRLATVKCEQGLTRKLGEEWLGLLPEMLPFISELREDDDEQVERETQRWINMVEEILGEDLEAMLQ